MAGPITELPDELNICIIEELGSDLAALRCLALTNKTYQALTEPILYRSLFLRKGFESKNILHALHTGACRSKSVRSIEARLEIDATTDLHCSLARILRRTTNLEELIIESPYCNNATWRSEAAGGPWASLMEELLLPIAEAYGRDMRGLPLYRGVPGPPPLQRLTSLTLHLNGDGKEFWTVRGVSAYIFTHSALENLHISSANLGHVGGTWEHVALAPGTPLKRLTLDECNVTAAALVTILSLPKALEYLYIGETRYSRIEESQGCNQLCARDPKAFFSALHQQHRTLQTLIYEPTETRGVHAHASANSSFGDFREMRTIEITAACPLIQKLLLSDLTAPPNLVRLAVREISLLLLYTHQISQSGVPSSVFSAVSVLPKLKELEFTYRTDLSWEDHFDSYPELEDVIKKYGKTLKGRGIAMRMWRIGSHHSVVRPILYGEKMEPDTLDYENDETGFRVEIAAGRVSDDDSDWDTEEDDMDEGPYEDNDVSSEDSPSEDESEMNDE
ncbi:hypothetical protein LTR08_000968 [Meristemomyces frigidus]|nr:hypothetical protein LTR08_000968 [Meristemomyces frigidus]